MKINLSDVDQENFRLDPHVVADETCYLIQPRAISAKWTKDTLIFRSSLWNAQGELISASFKKFFNWSEQPDLCYTPFSLTANGGCELMEKIDGSTLIVSRYKGQLIVRTRGTVDASKIDNGFEIEYLKQKYPLAFELPEFDGKTDYSLIFEWTTPTNKIVIDYGEEPEIRLIGLIFHEDYSLASQEFLDICASKIGVKRPARYNFASLKEMHAAVEAFKGKEGLCVYCNHGQDIRKVKGAEYLAAHRMKGELGSYDKVVDLWFVLGQPTFAEFENYINSHFDFELFTLCRGHASIICEGAKEVKQIIAAMREKVEPLKKMARKDAAQIILQAYGQTNRSGMAFTLLDGKELEKDVNSIKKLLYQVTKD